MRHGESLWNAQGRLQGQSGTGLSPLGEAQAAATADYLSRRYRDAAVCARSDLRRVEDTARPWVEQTSVPVRVDERLREIDVGTWSGRTWAEVTREDPDTVAAWHAGHDVARGGGETFGQLRRRVWSALTEILQAEGTAVVFTHGGPIRVAVAAALDLPPLGERALSPVENCSITELSSDGGRCLLAGYNLHDHLVGVAAPMPPQPARERDRGA